MATATSDAKGSELLIALNWKVCRLSTLMISFVVFTVGTERRGKGESQSWLDKSKNVRIKVSFYRVQWCVMDSDGLAASLGKLLFPVRWGKFNFETLLKKQNKTRKCDWAARASPDCWNYWQNLVCKQKKQHFVWWKKKQLRAAHFTLLSMQLWIALLKTATKKSASSMVTHMGGLIRKVWHGEKKRRESRYERQVENTHHRRLGHVIQVKGGLSHRNGTTGSHVEMVSGFTRSYLQVVMTKPERWISYLSINSSFPNQDSHVLHILKDLIHDLRSQRVPAGLRTMDKGTCLKTAGPNTQANKAGREMTKQKENPQVCLNHRAEQSQSSCPTLPCSR